MKKLLLCTAILVSFSHTSAAFAQVQPDAPVSAVAPAPVVTPAPQVPAAPGENTVTAPPADGTMLAVMPPANAPIDPAVPQPVTPIEKEISEQLSFQKPTVNVNMMPSLFFTVWEHDLVLDARRGLITRDPMTEDGIAETGPRDIALGGIVYHNRSEWTIWLNSLRVSPTAIPDEVLDLKVYKDYIELEWFDESTNQIFPIRMRPHQRFNLDTRMFLPG
jgi:hypothetical protein